MNNYIREKFLKKLAVYQNIAPVFSYLLVLIFAFLLGDILELSKASNYVLVSIGLAFLILSFQFNKKIFSLCFFFCFCLLFYDMRREEVEFKVPAMDTSLDIKVNAINTTNERYISGYASILYGYDLDKELCDKEIFFVLYGKEHKLDTGSQLNLIGSLSSVNEDINGFDSFLARQKISYKFTANEANMQVQPLGYFAKTLQGIRAYIARNIANSSPEYERYLAMYRALMIGDMSMVDKADKQIFAKSASIHIFAISGLHVGLVASLLFMLFRVFGVRYSVSILISLALLYVYVQVCGAKPSAMRAYMMLFFVALAYLLRRRANTFNALLLSAILALLYEPKNLFNIGFLLSYCVVASIVLFGFGLYDYLSKKYTPYSMLPEKLLNLAQKSSRRFYGYLLMSACISFSAFIGGGFLCSYFFGYVAWSSIINFIIFIPLVSLILPLGFVSLFLPSFMSFYLNDFILLLLKFMTSIATFFSNSIFRLEAKIDSAYFLVISLTILFGTLIYLKDKRDLRLIYLPISIFSLVLLISN